MEMLDTREDIERLVEKPAEFVESLGTAAGPAGKKFALAKARPRITKALEQSGLSPPLTFEDVLPMSGGEKAGSRGWWVRSVPTGEGWRCRVGGRSCAARG